MSPLDLYVQTELNRFKEERHTPAASHRLAWQLMQSRRRAVLRQAVLRTCGDRLVRAGERLRAEAAALQEPAFDRG